MQKNTDGARKRAQAWTPKWWAPVFRSKWAQERPDRTTGGRSMAMAAAETRKSANRAAAFGSCRCLETNVDNVFISGTCVRGPNGLAPLLHDLCQSCDHVPPSSWFWPCLLLRHCKLFISEYLNILLSTFSTFCPESDNVPAGKSIQGLGENLIGNRILTAH